MIIQITIQRRRQINMMTATPMDNMKVIHKNMNNNHTNTKTK